MRHLPCSQLISVKSHPWGTCLSRCWVHCTPYCRLLTREAAWSQASHKEITMLEQPPGSSTHSCGHKQELQRGVRSSITALPFSPFLTPARCVHCSLSKRTWFALFSVRVLEHGHGPAWPVARCSTNAGNAPAPPFPPALRFLQTFSRRKCRFPKCH